MEQWLNISQDYLNIVLVVVAILSLATIVNLILKKVKKNSPAFNKISIIIKSWWIIAATVLISGFFGRYGFLALFIVIILLVLKEFFPGKATEYLKKYLQLFSIIYTAALAYFIHTGNFDLFAAFPFIFALCTVPFLLLFKDTIGFLPQIMASYFGILFIIQCLLYLPALVFVGPAFFGDYNKSILVFFLAVGLTQANDVFQFIFGKLFGKRKIVPHLSPNKTEAGFIGGLMTTSLVGAFLFSHFFDYSIAFSLLLSFCISLFGIFGDLSFSAVKRYFDIKDFSNLLPGHGGAIDRLDSIIFSGPIIFHIVKFYTEVNL